MILMATFGEWLHQARKSKGWTQQKLADETEVSKSYISMLERDLQYPDSDKTLRPSEEIVEVMARALGADHNQGRLAAGYKSIVDEDEETRVREPKTPDYSGKNVIRLPREDTYESFTEDEKERILDTFQPLSIDERKRVLKMIDLAFPNRPALDDDFTTFGKRHKDEDEDEKK